MSEVISQNFLYIALFISQQIFSTKKTQILVLFLVIITSHVYLTKISIKAKNKTFEKDYLNILKEGSISKDLMKNKIYVFSGDKIAPSEFFTQLGDANQEMMLKYKNKVSFFKITINDRVSSSFKTSGILKEDKKVKKDITSKDLEQKELRFTQIEKRKISFLDNSQTQCLSVYFEDGTNQDVFERNVKNYKGRLRGQKEPKETMRDNWKGQIIVIKNEETKAFLIFREAYGEQSHNVGKGKYNKILIYYGLIENLEEQIKSMDANFYDLMETYKLKPFLNKLL